MASIFCQRSEKTVELDGGDECGMLVIFLLWALRLGKGGALKTKNRIEAKKSTRTIN